MTAYCKHPCTGEWVYYNDSTTTKVDKPDCEDSVYMLFYQKPTSSPNMEVPKEKFEFESIHASLGPVIGQISAKELQDKGVLSECHVNVVQLIDTVVHSDYQSELKYLVTNTERIKYIGKLLNSVKDSGNTLILVDRISAGEMHTQLLKTF